MLNKKDLKISFFIGIGAGLLAIPVLVNLDIAMDWRRSLLSVVFFTASTSIGYLVAYLLSGRMPVMLQVVKFGIIGGFNTFFDLGILNLLIYLTGLASGWPYSAFKSISFVCAVTNSYFWNKYWTFKSEGEANRDEFLKFLLVNIGGFILNIGGASIVVNIIGAPAGFSPNAWANIGAVSAIAISLIWNFIGMKFFVFRK